MGNIWRIVSNDMIRTASSVHIVLSDRGWILERLAKELADRLPYVRYGDAPDPSAAIQYYVTYGCRRERVSPVEVALFTHREDDVHAAARFDAVARDVEHAVAMSRATMALIETLGVASASCIMPGVDLEHFQPRIKIGVVGRTYHTGRKGEALVRAVMDVPGIEWHFTGEGWPGPAEHIPESDLPAFYRAMDYILVPALNEGGPMSVLEALASGTPVIASMVGWVPEFPHIPFERGNVESLRNVLEEIRQERLKLREAVEHVTWDRWAEAHDALFRRLSGTGPHATEFSVRAPASQGRVALVTHGLEDTTLGGPSRRVPGTATALQALGVEAVVSHGVVPADADLVHGFNVWGPKTALKVAREAKRLGKPLVFSPILLNFDEAQLWQVDIFRAFRAAANGAEAEVAMQHFVKLHRERRALHPTTDPEPGYYDMVGEIARLSDGLIFLSERERASFGKLVGPVDVPEHLVRNPVDARHFSADVDRDLFRNAYGLQDYVLCVARIEPRKNQLMLVNALRDSGLPIVLIGHESHSEYADLIRRYGGPNVMLVGRLDPQSDLLRSAIAGARVFVLPSWTEGAPLTALEAAACGANMVLSDRSGEREYIGDCARYCDPADSDSIRDQVLAAWDSPISENDAAALATHVQQSFSWQSYARETLAAYENVRAVWSSEPSTAPKAPHASSHAGEIIFDVTTWANNPGTSSGIVRVERSIAQALATDPEAQVRFVMFSSPSMTFIEVPRAVIARDVLHGFIASLVARAAPELSTAQPAPGGEVVAVGSSWMMNSDYARELINFTRDCGCRLSVMMHDLTPALFPHWYGEGYGARWSMNCKQIITGVDRLLVYSESTRRDIERFAATAGIPVPAMEKVRLADEIGGLQAVPTQEGLAARAMLEDKPYVLSVGGIHLRKNYGLLYDVWLILREKMGDACPHLVIVGGVSWNGAETARVMQEDPRVRGYIHILDNIDDASLAELYDQALLTAYPSLYEGWGLPVGESLAHGKICLSSNRSSMPEIAPALTDFLDPYDRISWAALIQHYAGSAASRAQREAQIRQDFVVTPWRETTRQIQAVLPRRCATRPAEKYSLGDIALVAEGGDGSVHLGRGWCPVEPWGRWTNARTASLRLRLAMPAREDLVLTMLARVLKPDGDAVRYDIRANGRAIGCWEFPASAAAGVAFSTTINRVRLPLEAIAGCDDILVEITASRIYAVRDLHPNSMDARTLGLGLTAFLLEPCSRSGDAATLFSTRVDVRQALDAGPKIDLAQMLLQTRNRPSPPLDSAINDFQPYCRGGVPGQQGGVHSAQGGVVVALGVAQFRLDRAATATFLIDAPHASPKHPVHLSLLQNGVLVHSVTLVDDAPTEFVCEISATRLAAVDPLLISIVASGTFNAASAEFFVHTLTLSQGMLLPSEAWPALRLDHHLRPGTGIGYDLVPNRMLVGGWSGLEIDGIWSLGATGGLRFAVPPSTLSTGVLELDLARIESAADDDRIAVLDRKGLVIAEVACVGGPSVPHRLTLPVASVADADGRVELWLAPNNLTWWQRGIAGVDDRRFGARLLGLMVRSAPPEAVASIPHDEVARHAGVQVAASAFTVSPTPVLERNEARQEA